MHNAQAFHRYFRGSQCKQDRAGIVNARVGVEENLFCHIVRLLNNRDATFMSLYSGNVT
jgi:hypothetical protein